MYQFKNLEKYLALYSFLFFTRNFRSIQGEFYEYGRRHFYKFLMGGMGIVQGTFGQRTNDYGSTEL